MGFSNPTDLPVAVTIVLYLPIPKSFSKKKTQDAIDGLVYPLGRKDIDNITKAILDGMNKIVYSDDNQVCELHVYKKYGTEPRAEVEVNLDLLNS